MNEPTEQATSETETGPAPDPDQTGRAAEKAASRARRRSVLAWVFGGHGASAWLWLSALVIVVDQATKWFVVQNFEYARPIVMGKYLDFTLLHNTGAAFSFLADAGGWQRWFFVILGVLVSVFIMLWLVRLPLRGSLRLAPALALILGGALGNVIDRVNYGYVIDFIHAHYEDLYWPAFNIADSAITLGAALLILDALFPGKSEGNDESRDDRSGARDE